MKSIFKIILGLAIAIWPLAGYAAAQEPEQDKEKPKQEEPKKQAPPQQKQEPKEKPKTEKQEPAPKEQKDQQKADQKQQEQNQKDQQKQAKQDEKKTKDEKQQPEQNQRQNARAQQSTTPPSGKAQRIPEQKFQAHFGREHHFHVGHLDDGRRFQYGGYWFEVTQVWPAGWSYDDDCYIEEDDDTYYLVDLYHPDVRLVVIVIAV